MNAAASARARAGGGSPGNGTTPVASTRPWLTLTRRVSRPTKTRRSRALSAVRAPSLTVHNPFGAQQCKARVELSLRPDFATVDWRFDFWWFEGDTTGPMNRNYLEGSTYYWRTKASLDGVTWGPWSSVWSFFTPSGGTVAGTPTLLAPADGTAVATLRPTFRWTAVPGATWYLLAVGRYTFMVEGTEMTPWVDLDPGVVQRWSVGARNGYGWGARSGEWTITTPAAAPDELELPR